MIKMGTIVVDNFVGRNDEMYFIIFINTPLLATTLLLNFSWWWCEHVLQLLDSWMSKLKHIFCHFLGTSLLAIFLWVFLGLKAIYICGIFKVCRSKVWKDAEFRTKSLDWKTNSISAEIPPIFHNWNMINGG